MKEFLNKIFSMIVPKKVVEKDEGPEGFLECSIVDDTIIENEDNETRFVRLYSEIGGKFLYAENESEILIYLKQIMAEDKFNSFWCANPKFQSYLATLGTMYSIRPKNEGQVNLIDCEYLIADNGSVMISSHQTDNRKLHEMSNTFIVIAYPDQIVGNISEGLRKIKYIKQNNIPTNITTIRGLKKGSLHQTTSSKNIYLLLMERPLC